MDQGQQYDMCLDHEQCRSPHRYEIMYYKTTKTMWDSLEDTYAHEKNSSLIFQIYCEIMNLKQGDKPLSQNYSQLKALMEKYNAC